MAGDEITVDTPPKKLAELLTDKTLVENLDDAKRAQILHKRDNDGKTALMYAAQNHLQNVPAILDVMKDLDPQDQISIMGRASIDYLEDRSSSALSYLSRVPGLMPDLISHLKGLGESGFQLLGSDSDLRFILNHTLMNNLDDLLELINFAESVENISVEDYLAFTKVVLDVLSRNVKDFKPEQLGGVLSYLKDRPSSALLERFLRRPELSSCLKNRPEFIPRFIDALESLEPEEQKRVLMEEYKRKHDGVNYFQPTKLMGCVKAIDVSSLRALLNVIKKLDPDSQEEILTQRDRSDRYDAESMALKLRVDISGNPDEKNKKQKKATLQTMQQLLSDAKRSAQAAKAYQEEIKALLGRDADWNKEALMRQSTDGGETALMLALRKHVPVGDRSQIFDAFAGLSEEEQNDVLQEINLQQLNVGSNSLESIVQFISVLKKASENEGPVRSLLTKLIDSVDKEELFNEIKALPKESAIDLLEQCLDENTALGCKMCERGLQIRDEIREHKAHLQDSSALRAVSHHTTIFKPAKLPDSTETLDNTNDKGPEAMI